MLNLEIVVVSRLENSAIPRQNSLYSLRFSGFSKVYDKMIATASSSTVTLDHQYAKKDELPDESDFFSNSTDFLSTWNSNNIGNPDEHDILEMLFAQDLKSFAEASPHSETLSSDSDMMPSPCMVDDAELSEILSSSSTSPGLTHSNEDFTIDFGWDMDFDLPGLEGNNKDDSELTSVTTSLPTTMASSSTATMSQTTTPVHVTAVSRTKAKLLVLSSEEQRLLEMEGVTLPTDMPLTKSEEKVLKKVRRKIKNKESAQESRRKKKQYVDGLEERVKACTELNHNLSKKVETLEKQNKSLLDQLKELQSLVASTQPTKAGTFLMVLFLAFGLALFPVNSKLGEQKEPGAPYASTVVRSRTLLQIQEEYVTDPEDFPQTVQFKLNNSDYLKATPPVMSHNPVSHEVTVEVPDLDNSIPEKQIKSEKR
ncbi:cyclic AMP-responsive element-binding protein 3-like protein 3-B isoform X2 [Acropora millepora]|uniref:cyclic AMP-responsive element-binding protein 3-like protein 3-B isoform X2 n=1 Tax=Acropora millepora TaxID=45264 RepID=UPI001CF3522C|nr:cyclic AMP-responsive element-binding protein 3-like protein 3-B isoform X2 [Acropora millepora]